MRLDLKKARWTQKIGVRMSINYEKMRGMKRYKFLAIVLLVLGMWSCADYKEEGTNVSEDGRYDEVLISLTSTKGQSIAFDETRVHVGNVSGSSVTHYWDEGDKVGIFTLNSTAKASNHEANIDVIMDNKNRATFSGMIQTSSNITNYDLFVYYPYNASLLADVSGSAATLLKNGLSAFRLPNEQLQSSYNTTLDNYDHPSRYAVSHYGIAYDLVDCKGTVGIFNLNHANTYLQFNVIGKQTANGDGTKGTDFTNGKHRLAHVIVEAGTFADGEYTNSVALAGNYKLSYNYNESNFTDTPENIVYELDGVGASAVKTTLQSPADGSGVPALSGTTRVPVFSVINTSKFTNAVNCLKVTATCNEYNESGAIVKVNTRIRYYNIAAIVAAGGMKGGDYYTINFEMSDPVESYTHLDAEGNSNCYILQGPGFYTFDVGMAGNGKYPGKDDDVTDTDFTIEELGFDPAKLITSDKFKLDWLLASGTSFDASKASGVTDDEEIVEKIITNIALSGTDGIMQIQLAEAASSLSGNIMVALYEDANNNSKCDASEKIVWSWHLWLGSPVAQHYKFANTDTDEALNNTDWYMLDRNLGAESNELGNPRSAGLYYQSGRKDPFIGYASQNGSTTWASNRLTTYLNTETFPSHAAWTTSSNGLTFNIDNVRNYPMSMFGATNKAEIFTYGWVQGTLSAINNSKTFFDPCPPGYKLPTTREWDNFKNSEYYNKNVSINGTGVFGYCAWKDASFSTNTAGTTMKARVNAGDYYEVNNSGERTYHIYKNSGNGQVLTTTFPNTGWLSAAGTYNALIGSKSTATVNIVGVPQLSSVSGTATTTTTTLASPTVQAEVTTSTQTVQYRIPALNMSVAAYANGQWVVTVDNASDFLNSEYDYDYEFYRTSNYTTPTSTTSATKLTLDSNGAVAITGSTSSSRSYYIWAYNKTLGVWSNYARFSRQTNPTVTDGASKTGSVSTTNYVYAIEMSRLSGLSYYWTTGNTFSNTNALTATQFNLTTTDNDIYIWATDGSNEAYTRLQYSNGNVTVTKQNAANESKITISNYVVAISNYDATKTYYWTTTPYFAKTNEIDLKNSVTISTSAEQIYIWAYNPNLDVNSASSMAYYANSRFGFTNGTPAADSSKTEVVNENGNFVLWSTGRIEGSSFTPMWFGAGSTGLQNEEIGSTNPYSQIVPEMMLIMYGPQGVNGANNSMSSSPAAGVRCIREYNVN